MVLLAFILSCCKLMSVRPTPLLFVVVVVIVIDDLTELEDCFDNDYDNDNDFWRWLWT